MLMLIVHTCGAEGLLALADEVRVLAEEVLPGRGAGEALLPGLRRLFAAVGRSPAELTAVVVVAGPGSFTGVRVGLSAGKGLAEAAGAGLLAMSRLALLAVLAPVGLPPLALLDAGRGELFCGWRDAEGVWMERLLSAEAARELMAGRGSICCEAQVQLLIGTEADLIAEPGGELIRGQAMLLILLGQWSDAVTADANYLRRTDAELLEDGLGQRP